MFKHLITMKILTDRGLDESMAKLVLEDLEEAIRQIRRYDAQQRGWANKILSLVEENEKLNKQLVKYGKKANKDEDEMTGSWFATRQG